MERFVMSMLAALVAFVCSAPQGGLHSLLAPAGWGIAEAIAQTAVANTITITNKSGAVITNYPFQFGRPFIAGSIPNQPQVLINGTAVVTQADVKNRYPDGSIKFAVIAVMIPTIPTTGSLTLTFRNQTLGNNTPLTQAQMLDPLYAFSAYIILSTPGAPGLAPQFVSAKQMLQNGDYQLWTSGPVAQTIILADNSTSRKYDLGFDGYRPFRPRFYATFWPATHQVALRYVGENGNSQELEDLSYDLTLVTGNIKGYTKTGLTHWVLTNWTKYFWLGGAPPAQVNIDPNIAYLASTRFIPNYDPAVSVPETEMAAYYSQWSSYPHDPYDAYYNHPLGNVVWTNDMSAAGGRNEIGPYPIWSLLWLYTGDWRMRQFALGMADLATAFPANLRETNTGKRLLRTDAAGSSTGLGHTIVTTDHKSLVFGAYYFLNPTGVVASDRVTVVGPISLSPPFSFDTAHEPSPFYLQYLVTGDPFYLNEMYLWAGSDSLRVNGQATIYPSGRGPTGVEGGIHNQIRGDGWMIRARAEIAFIAPDVDPEKPYFTILTNEALARWEGGFNITGTPYQGNTMWNWGRTMGVSNVPGGPLFGTIPPLNAWETLCTPPFDHTSCVETNNATYGPTAASTMSPWMHYYLMYGLSRAKELGFAAGPLLSYSAKFLIDMVNDSGVPKMSGIYQIPNVVVPGVWIPDWPSVPLAFSTSYQATGIATDFANGLAAGGNSYPAPASAASALAYDEPRGAQTWAWFKQNVYFSVTGSALGIDPRWPIIPRTDSNTLPAIPAQ